MGSANCPIGGNLGQTEICYLRLPTHQAGPTAPSPLAAVSQPFLPPPSTSSCSSSAYLLVYLYIKFFPFFNLFFFFFFLMAAPTAYGKFPGQGLNPCLQSDLSCFIWILNPLCHDGNSPFFSLLKIVLLYLPFSFLLFF